jgi:hypothetical protein
VFYLKQNQTNKKPQGLNEGKEKEEENGKNKKENKIKDFRIEGESKFTSPYFLCFKTFPFLFFKLNLQSNSEVYFLH